MSPIIDGNENKNEELVNRSRENEKKVEDQKEIVLKGVKKDEQKKYDLNAVLASMDRTFSKLQTFTGVVVDALNNTTEGSGGIEETQKLVSALTTPINPEKIKYSGSDSDKANQMATIESQHTQSGEIMRAVLNTKETKAKTLNSQIDALKNFNDSLTATRKSLLDIYQSSTQTILR